MKVKFVPIGKEIEIKPGQSVMHLAEDNGIYIKSVCRGVPSCAECRVYIVDGEDNVFKPNHAELQLIGSGWFLDRRRLSCQMMCMGDVTVDVSEQLAKQKELKEAATGLRTQKAIRGDRVEEETVIRDRSESTSDEATEGGAPGKIAADRPSGRRNRPEQGRGPRPDRNSRPNSNPNPKTGDDRSQGPKNSNRGPIKSRS